MFLKPGEPDLYLVKRLIGVPGDHIHLRGGIVYVNGVAQPQPPEGLIASVTGSTIPSSTSFPPSRRRWTAAQPKPGPWIFPTTSPTAISSFPPGKFFMMGDHRHDSLDSRYWGFVPRENIVGRPLFNYWSFKTPEHQYEETGIGSKVAWLGHVVIHFFTDTRWNRTLKMIH